LVVLEARAHPDLDAGLPPGDYLRIDFSASAEHACCEPVLEEVSWQVREHFSPAAPPPHKEWRDAPFSAT
jgi:hypothetical protein